MSYFSKDNNYNRQIQIKDGEQSNYQPCIQDHGENGLKQLAIDADGLRQIMEENVKIAVKLNKGLVNRATAVTMLSAAKDALQSLTWAEAGAIQDKIQLTVSFQFHHTKIDGAHAVWFLGLLQKAISNV